MLHTGGNELTYMMVKSCSFRWPLPELSNVWAELSWKNGIHLFPAFPSNRIPLSNKWAMYTSYGRERWKIYASWTRSPSIFILWHGHSRIFPSCSFSALRPQGKCPILRGFSPDIHITFAQPHDALCMLCFSDLCSIPIWNHLAHWLFICYVCLPLPP